MAKLIVNIDQELVFFPIVVLEDDGHTIDVRGDNLLALLAGTDESQFNIGVASIDQEFGGPHIVFEMYKKSKSKCDFSWTIDSHTGHVSVVARGEFVSKSLRSGVVPTIEEYGGAADFRITKFQYKSGMWSNGGFEAAASGYSEQEIAKCPKVNSWLIK